MAHSLAEVKLRHIFGQIEYEEYQREVEIIKNTPYFNEDFEANVDNYVLYVRSQVGEGDTPLFEQRVDFSDWVPDGFGTADVVILSKHSIRVIDLKFGKGVPVSALHNTQLRLYALGAYSKFKEEYPDIKEVSYTIHQPRLDSISSDGTSVAKLVDWANYYVKPKAKKAWSGTGDFLPGEWCQFCRAKATCRARSDYNNDVAKLEFREPALLNDDEVSLVLTKAQNIRTWVNDVEEYILNRAVEQHIIPSGYKLSTTVTHRRITDQTLAATVLVEKGIPEEQIWEPKKLKSLATLEKINKQVVTYLGDLIQRPEGQPKLVVDKQSAKEDFA